MKKRDIQSRLNKAVQLSPVRERIRRISLFGSYLHGNATKESDVDLLIEFSQPVSMLKLVRMERELSEQLGRKVDLCTPNSISRYFRDDVLQEAETLYESVL